MNTLNQSKLSDKPSELLRQACDDLRKVEQDAKYVVRMGTWHSNRRYGTGTTQDKCHVCLAGATIACRLGTPATETVVPHDFDNKIKDKLIALDSFRTGEVYDALYLLGIEDLPESVEAAVETTEYDDNRGQFYKDMESIALKLEAAGL